MEKSKKIIGILGGMGPGASAYLYERIVALAAREYSAKDNNDFPEIILHSVPVPDFISSNRNKEKALLMLKGSIAKLDAFPVTILGIACNTAHILLPELQKATKAQFVSIVEEVVREIESQKVGLLATSSTIRFRIYHEKLKQKGIEVLVPDRQQEVDRIVKKILAGKASYEDKERIISLAEQLKKQGAKAIILGCTELPLLFPKKFPLPVFNSVEILARALLRETML